MVKIGTDQIPGVQTTVDTADTVGIGNDAPAIPCLVGPADLTNGTASANDVKEIRRAETARDEFGEAANSMLTQAVFDALGEGAMPVYAIATAETDITGEDLSGLASTSGTLANAPVSEVGGDAAFTIDGVAKTTVITYDDPSTKSPGADEVYLNPVTGAFELDAAPGDADSTNDTVDYTYFDYKTAFGEASDQRGEDITFLAPIQEESQVTSDALSEMNTQEGFYELSVALCGLEPDVTIQSDMSADVTWDDSRLQVAHPTRNSDGETAIGSWAGRKASLGIDASAMGKPLATQGRMRTRISQQNEIDLVDNNVVPIRSSTGGARIVDDPTTVTDNNSEEAGMKQGYSRLVMDEVIETVYQNEQPFIGRLNTQGTRNALENLINAELEFLLQAQAIQDYQVTVSERDAMSADVNVTVDTTDPLRNIYNTVTAGEVN